MDRVPIRLGPGLGGGLDGPPCPQRDTLAQGTPAGMLPCGAMCRRCGRVTARRDPDGRAWCGGNLPEAGEGR